MTDQPFWNPKTELMPREDLRELQLAELRRVVAWAKNRSPHYRRDHRPGRRHEAGARFEHLTDLTV